MVLSKKSDADLVSINNGVEEYIKMNGLDKISERLDETALRKYMEVFLKPLDSFDGKALYEYFVDFVLFNKFKTISNNIFNVAKAKLLHENIEPFTAKKDYDELLEIYPTLYKNISMQNTLDFLLSESKLDFEYINNNSNQYSLRLGKIVSMTS